MRPLLAHRNVTDLPQVKDSRLEPLHRGEVVGIDAGFVDVEEGGIGIIG